MKKSLVLLTILLINFSFTAPVTERLTKEKLWEYIIECNIKYPELVFAQALLETGTFKSNVFKKNNNLFGMKVPGKRPTIAKNTDKKSSNTYALYNSWKESIQDYKLYQDYIFRKKVYSEEEYTAHLGKRYSETATYVSLLKKIINSHKYLLN